MKVTNVKAMYLRNLFLNEYNYRLPQLLIDHAEKWAALSNAERSYVIKGARREKPLCQKVVSS
jgi:hypothetical protein